MTATQEQKNRRELLTKKPFYRINADVGPRTDFSRGNLGEQPLIKDELTYDIVTQSDFLRELDPNSHAINDRTIYQNWVQKEKAAGSIYPSPRATFSAPICSSSRPAGGRCAHSVAEKPR